MNIQKASRQRFALIVGEGVVREVGEITVTVHGDRVMLEGAVLTEGHPVHDAPVVNGSQNPEGYCALEEETPFVFRACGGEGKPFTDSTLPVRCDRRSNQGRQARDLLRLTGPPCTKAAGD